MDYSNLFVCLMGMGTVFIGLICLIILVSAMSSVVRKTDRAMESRSKGLTSDAGASSAPLAAAAPSAGVSAVSGITPELIAAVSAAIAEESGTDVSAIRIRSFKKIQ